MGVRERENVGGMKESVSNRKKRNAMICINGNQKYKQSGRYVETTV